MTECWLKFLTEDGERDLGNFSVSLNCTTASFQHWEKATWQAGDTPLSNTQTHTHARAHTHTHTQSWLGWVVSLEANS